MAWFVIDYRVLLYTLLISLGSGVAFGLGPALAASRPDLNEFIKEGGRGLSGGASRLRTVLVVSELAIGLMLLAGTGLLAKTMARLRYVDAGYRTENLLSGNILLQGARYEKAEARQRYWNDLVSRLRSAPGIAEATVSNNPPLCGGAMSQEVAVEGGPARAEGEYMQVAFTVAGPRYLELLGQKLLAGRDFVSADRPGGPHVALVNEAFSRRFWRSPSSAVGSRIRLGKEGPWMTVAGVVGNVRQALDQPPLPEVLRPLSQSEDNAMNVIVRGRGDSRAAKATVRNEVRALDPDVPVLGPSDIEDLKENFYPMVMIVGIGVFAFMATLLAAVGLYGVVSFLVVRRTREIGVRAALGATRGCVIRMVLGETLKLAAWGTGFGLAGAYALARVLESFLLGVSPADPVVFSLVTVLLCIVAALASAVPALRAARVDPMSALRWE